MSDGKPTSSVVRTASDGVAAGGASDEAAGELAAVIAENALLRAAVAAGEARERRLLDELQHRVRNMLATIRSIYRQSMSTDAAPEEFARRFQGRLDAIARTQTYFGGARPSGIEVEDMIRDELLSTRCLDGPRCVIDGPAVRLHGKQAELMGLAIHELAANAIAFGALGSDGTVSIAWSVDREVLHFRWSEDGVHIGTAAQRPPGFGRQVIEEALPYQLGATTTFQLNPGGVACIISLPLPDRPDVQPDNARHDGGDRPIPPTRTDGPT